MKKKQNYHRQDKTSKGCILFDSDAHIRIEIRESDRIVREESQKHKHKSSAINETILKEIYG